MTRLWRRRLTTVALAAFAAAPALAEVEVTFDPAADFSRLATYAWKSEAVVAADNAETQGWIVAAVERELAARGLSPVAPGAGDPDVWIVTYAGSSVAVNFTAPYLNGTWTKDIEVHGTEDVIEGTLVVSLVDPTTDDLLWRGIATRSIDPKKRDKLRAKIDKAASDLFKGWPAAR
jgi:hypothetical protein